LNSLFSSKRGMTMIEVCIALFLVAVGVLALITLQPTAWRLSGKSDYLGRASGILSAQLQTLEAQIINPNNPMPTSDSGPVPVYVSGQSGQQQQGDAAFSVTRTITAIPNTTTWRVNVVVTWPGSPTGGIRESMIVSRQQSFLQ
jgi:prepilin-type N-terminal cleavage/methylation domain-containing protein